MRYLFRFRPLEPYAFGTDQGFSYAGEPGTGKESYFVTSGTLPSQTTLFGTVRYLLLRWSGLLDTGFGYSRAKRSQMAALIGPRSFSFDEERSFGAIQRMSPLFLMQSNEGANEILIPNPFCNKAERNKEDERGEYDPIRLGRRVRCSEGYLNLPMKGEYDIKKWHGSGYLDLDSLKVVPDPFGGVFVPGVRKNGDGSGSNADSFYMRQLVTTGDGSLSFAVTVDIDDEVARDLCVDGRKEVCHMGKRRSAFEVATEQSQLDIADRVRSSFAGCAGPWTLALSNLHLQGDWEPKGFCIVEESHHRGLSTDYDAKRAMHRFRKDAQRLNFIQAGSVFAGDVDLPLDANAQRIGYDITVVLGGA